MFQVNKKKDLEGFGKNKKRNIIIIASILGILIVVGVITLFRTFAFFEDKRDFNVLKGRVPEFSHEDIQLAFTINGEKGEKFPTIEEGLVAKNVTCANGATARWSNSLWALTNVNSNGNKKVYCSVEFVTSENINLYENVSIGDYVSYTPILKQYEITSAATGYESKQVINPSELTLWRVIRKNEDGSIDLVSEYTSSQNIYFKGKEGYKKYIGTLNRIANSYETPGITSGSRYMGYNGQTEFISDESKLNQITVSWTEATTLENSPKGSEREAQGGGDKLYTMDETLVKAACGNSLDAKIVHDKSDASSYYWLGSRYFGYVEGTWYFNVRNIVKGVLNQNDSLYGSQGDFEERSYDGYLRPIITLKYGIQASSGNGSKDNSWKVN